MANWLLYPEVKNMTTKGTAGDSPDASSEIDSEQFIKDKMKYVLFVPRVFDLFSEVASSINSLDDSTSMKDFVSKIFNAASDTAKSLGSISSTKDSFLRSLRGVKLNDKSSDLVIGLPLKQEFLTQINHNMEWKMEKNRLNDTTKKFAELVRSGINFNAENASASFENVKSAAGSFLAQAGKEAIIGAAQKGFRGFDLGTVGLTSYSPEKKSFEKVGIMTFTFDWEFMPRNLDETKTIRDIIDAFRVLSYPWIDGNETAGEIEASVVHQPCLWEIYFPPYSEDGVDKNSFQDIMSARNKFLCIVDSVKFSLGSENPEAKYLITMPDGTPNVIKMTVEMSEYFTIQNAVERFGPDTVGKFAINK